MNAISELFSSHLGEALGWTLLHSLWQALAIALVAGVTLMALRQYSAALRYRLAAGAMLAILVVAIFTFGHYYYKSPERPGVSLEEALEPVLTGDDVEVAIQPSPLHEIPDYEAVTSDSWTNYFNRHLPLIVTFWFVGMGIFLLRLLSNLAYVNYLKTHLVFPVEGYWEGVLGKLMQRLELQRPVQLLESALVKSPVLVGYLKPIILFPIGMINRLETEEAEAVLAHELAHVLRHDYLFNLLQGLIEAIFYFNPAVWWLSAKVREEREMAADELAIQITGDSLGFAKALVLMQEMAAARGGTQPALAFAGNRKSQLFNRIQRILHIKSPNHFNMEKIIGILAVVLALTGLGYTQAKNSEPIPEAIGLVADLAAEFSGVWQGEIEDDRLCLSLTRRRQTNSWSWSNSDCFPLSDFSSLPKNGEEGSFSMTRAAGKMEFTGKFEGQEGYGKFSFLPDSEFANWLKQQGITGIDDDTMVLLFLGNTDRAYVTALKQAGYNKISGDDLAGLAIHRVDMVRIKAYRDLARDLGEGDPSIETILGLSIHEVTPEYAKQLEGMGFKNLKLEDVMSFKIHEITPEYVKQVNGMGFTNLSAEDVMSFKIHEVTPAYLQSLKQSGLTNLSAEDVVGMKIHDVHPETVEKFRDMGFEDLNQDELVSLQIHEVSPEFMAEMKRLGFDDLSADEAMSLRIHEVSADYVADLAEAGFRNLSPDEVIACKIHEVDADYAAALRKAGFDNLSVDDVVSSRIHEVSPEQVKEMNDLGFTNINIDDAVALRIHEVTPDFIKKMRDKGFKDLDLDDYIELKIRFGDKLE